MSSKSLVAAVLAAVAVAVAGCSKTQDTAPETRVFGSPPVIESVTFTVVPDAEVQCDLSENLVAYFCANGFTGIQLDAPIRVTGTYTELRMQAVVSDPDAVPPNNDILLMGASYIPVIEDPVVPENTLVMYDDGGNRQFPVAQRSNVPFECELDEASGTCSCGGVTSFPLNTNDAVQGDGMFSRNFSFIDNGLGSSDGGLLFMDCIMRVKNQFPQLAPDDPTYEFSFDAVDNRGNITSWPERYRAKIVPAAYTCAASEAGDVDECGCCIVVNWNSPDVCKGKPGMRSNEFPGGICMEAFP